MQEEEFGELASDLRNRIELRRRGSSATFLSSAIRFEFVTTNSLLLVASTSLAIVHYKLIAIPPSHISFLTDEQKERVVGERVTQKGKEAHGGARTRNVQIFLLRG